MNLLTMVREAQRKWDERRLRLLTCAFCRLVFARLTDVQREAVRAGEHLADGRLKEWERDDVLRALECQARKRRGDHFVNLNCSARYCLRPISRDDVPWDGPSQTLINLHGWGKPKKAGPIPSLETMAVAFRDLEGPASRPRQGPVTGQARALADVAYEGDWGALAPLSDCLEELGWDEQVLAHLREDGPHFRGCWALELIGLRPKEKGHDE